MIGSGTIRQFVEHVALDQAAIWVPYCGAAPAPAELLARWNFDPVLIAVLVLMTAGYWRFARAGDERCWLLAGMALLTFLFVSPLCAMTSALFSARTVHHLVLTAVAAPFLAGAIRASPVRGGVAFWTGAHALTFWLWHAPSAYEVALSDEVAYWLMQSTLLVTAVALWRGVRGAALPAGTMALLATMVQMGLLGALLTFFSTPLYTPHALGPLAWGFTPLEDQQLAGLIMGAPGAGIYLAAAVALAARWFALERREAVAP